MEVAYFYPQSVSQGNMAGVGSFKNLGNALNDSTSNVAETTNNDVTATNILKFSGFQVSLPNLAEIEKVELEYCHRKVNYQNDNPAFRCYADVKTENVDMTSFTLTGGQINGLPYRNNPNTNFVDNIVNLDLNTDFSRINFYLVYMNNSTETQAIPQYGDGLYSVDYVIRHSKGYVQLAYVRLKITYNLPSFSLIPSRNDNHNSTGQETRLTITINNLNRTKINPNVFIDLPTGISVVSSTEYIRVNGSTLVWSTGLNSDTLSKTLSVVFQIDTTGSKVFTISESTNSSVSTSVSFTASQGVESTDTYENVLAEEFEPIIITTDSTGLTDVYSSIHPYVGDTVLLKVLVDGETLAKLDSITLTGGTTHIETVATLTDSNFVDNEAVIPIYPTSKGIEHLQVSYDLLEDGQTTTYLGQHYTLYIMPADMTYPFLTIFSLTEEERARLGDKTVYTIENYIKLNTEETEVCDWLKNYRIGVYNPDDYDNSGEDPTVEDMLDEIEYWSQPLHSVNTWEKVTCEFVYHHGTPFFIFITGDYMEGNPQDNTIDYTAPIIVESDVYNGWEPTGNYPKPINNSLSFTEFASLDIKTFETGTPIILSEFDFGEGFGTTSTEAVSGLILEFGVNYADETAVVAKLKSPTGKTGTRSIVIKNSGGDNTNYTIGSPWDTWGFNITELVNLSEWELEINISNLNNTGESTTNIQFNNLRLTACTNQVDDAPVKIFVDGVDTRFYGLFLRNVTLPEGLETNTKYLEIDGTDSHDAYRQNIARKEITLTFDIDSCSIDDTAEVLRSITNLFQNKRDKLNRPIPKILEMSNYPDLYWEYVITNAFDTTFDVANAIVEIKLEIPSGTAFAKQNTVTNINGAVLGLAKVNPIIRFIPTSENIEIYEVQSNQKFNIGYSNWNTSNIVEIDCRNRKVYLLAGSGDVNPIDISNYVDMNVDWFILHGEYEFRGTNAIIQSIITTERW